MKKEELKKIILEEALHIKSLVEEKAQIEEELKKLEEEDMDETTGLGKSGEKLKKEEGLEEMQSVGLSSSHQSGAGTTNPQFQSREKKGYVKEEQTIRKFVRNQLYESYGINKNNL
jgi:hypothetical protein